MDGLIAAVLVILTIITILVFGAYNYNNGRSEANSRWENACSDLGVKIRWHSLTIDGVTTNWVEMINLRGSTTGNEAR